MLSTEQRALRARIGAYALHAQRDARETTAAARASFLAKFERQVDPDGSLDPEERRRRAEAARRAHFARMALRSATSRQKSRRHRKTPAAQEARQTSVEPSKSV